MVHAWVPAQAVLALEAVPPPADDDTVALAICDIVGARMIVWEKYWTGR